MASPRKPITVLGLGLGGVNLVKNPLTLDDNEVTLAQNAVPFTESGVSGIRKRDGWQRVVPTGSVSPGSDAGGAILGGFVIDEPLGYLPPDTATGYGNGYSFDPATNTWTPFTPDQTSGPLPNVCMNYEAGYDITKSTVYPPIPFATTGSYFMGGHESGQIIELVVRRGPVGGPVNQFVAREVARIVGTGSVDDTYLLPCWVDLGASSSLVVALENGGVWTFEPISGATTKLPTVPNATRVSGAVWNSSRLWVCAGLHIYTIGVDGSGNWDTAWQDAATVSDSGIAQLVGMANLGTGAFQVGSYLSTGTLPNNLRLYVFSPTTSDGATWTATALAFPGSAGVQSNGTALVQVSNSPAAFVPYPAFIVNDARLYSLYVGTAGAFVTLWGSQSEAMAGTSVRLLSYDQASGWWHNGADTDTDDLQTDYASGNAIDVAAPALSLDGKRVIMGNHITGDKWTYIARSIFTAITFGPSATAGAVLPTSFWDYPAILL